MVRTIAKNVTDHSKPEPLEIWTSKCSVCQCVRYSNVWYSSPRCISRPKIGLEVINWLAKAKVEIRTTQQGISRWSLMHKFNSSQILFRKMGANLFAFFSFHDKDRSEWNHFQFVRLDLLNVVLELGLAPLLQLLARHLLGAHSHLKQKKICYNTVTC